MNTKGKLIIGAIVLIVIFFIGLAISNELKVSVVNDCKIIDLQQQQLISGDKNNMRTEIRYLVITDKETFICESSMINGKFDNSNIFFNLQKDKTYNFKVAGYGKSFWFDYKNIIEIIQ